MLVLNKFNNASFDKKTNVHCFYCCHSFNTQPLSMPFQYINKQFYVKYCFCSWECMKSFNNESNETNTAHIFSLISLFYTHITGKFNSINFAPCKYKLEMFGGDMSINEFRNIKNKERYILANTPIILSNPLIEKVENFSWINKTSAVESFEKFDRDTATSSNKIKLKRSTQTSSKNTLENVMGLIRKN